MSSSSLGPDLADLAGARVCVAGLGVTGPSAVRALLDLGATVVAVEGRTGERERALANQLRTRGATVELGTADTLPESTDLVLTSPGWRPDSPLLVAALCAGVPVWGDVELAYRLRPADQVWLGVTGTNGKTTTVQMLESILRAGGYRAVACGNVGIPVLDAVLDPEPYDVLAVEVSSFQLHWMSTVQFRAAAVLNLAPDHLDWHGSMEAYAAAKASIWRDVLYAVYNADDAAVQRLLEVVPEDASTFDFTLGPVAGHCFGVLDDVLVDCCFGLGLDEMAYRYEAGGIAAVELARVFDVSPAAPHNVANALAAAALARAFGNVEGSGLPLAAIGAGLRAFSPGAHRIAEVARLGEVAYVDDSKATNPHAAAASLAAYDSVIWVAGGLAKGASFDELVAGARSRLRGVVLLGADRALLREALVRHAPEIPVVEVERTDTGAMNTVVAQAAELARPGDTVLLAPACASMDMFPDYAARGDAFAAAARALVRRSPEHS